MIRRRPPAWLPARFLRAPISSTVWGFCGVKTPCRPRQRAGPRALQPKGATGEGPLVSADVETANQRRPPVCLERNTAARCCGLAFHQRIDGAGFRALVLLVCRNLEDSGT